MKVEVRATIKTVGEITTTDSGAKWLNFRAETVEEYPTLIEVKIYKKPEHAEHADNFVKYNKVGDLVDLELSIRTNEWKDKLFTSLNLWKITKVEGDKAPTPVVGTSDDLPL